MAAVTSAGIVMVVVVAYVLPSVLLVVAVATVCVIMVALWWHAWGHRFTGSSGAGAAWQKT